MGKLDDEVLCSVLRPLAYWYEQENIEEVAINHPGDIWPVSYTHLTLPTIA